MPFNSSSALFIKMFKLFLNLKLIVLSCFRVRKKLLSDSSYDTDMTFFCHEVVLKRSETLNLSITLSNFIMFWNSLCSRIRKSVGDEPILIRKLASHPQNLLCHSPLKEIKNF